MPSIHQPGPQPRLLDMTQLADLLAKNNSHNHQTLPAIFKPRTNPRPAVSTDVGTNYPHEMPHGRLNNLGWRNWREDLRGHRDCQDHKDYKGLMGQRDHQGHQDLLDPQDHRDLWEN
ncbi:hypothetical protein GYMLUDRAFT_63624 [Collybiopsis luxurians FD-317 M1]|uniref:Uncharacterized protein n=1 Tax=Collybiopsis luxurians FD-317 M1 TaxID=944289 RepID=A0A0D0CFE1_9AGAR|nr:hypothetical protein GYMLUDRAFT_63624 [Collybiopsis luxurians FD-317 M1]